MNKFLTSAFVLLATSLSAFAVPTWVALLTEGYGKNTGIEKAGNYSAYYCKASDWKSSETTAGALTNYLSGDNAAAGRKWFEDNATSFASTDYDSDGEVSQYTFLNYVPTKATDDQFIAVVFYNTTDFRAFGSGSALMDSGNVIFAGETAASGSIGNWTAVPEPTSGLLLLLGVAGLALKRKNGK